MNVDFDQIYVCNSPPRRKSDCCCSRWGCWGRMEMGEGMGGAGKGMVVQAFVCCSFFLSHAEQLFIIESIVKLLIKLKQKK